PRSSSLGSSSRQTEHPCPKPFNWAPTARSLGGGPRLVFLEHHFGRLNDDGHLVSLLQCKFIRTPARYHAFDDALADSDVDMSHDVINHHRDDFSFELV